MKRSYFGTDGVRGLYGGPVINPEFAYRLGFAAGVYAKGKTNNDACKVVIGRDTRSSGVVLEKALAVGLSDAGCDVFTLGVLPTPAVSLAVLNYKACIGVVITASHNPAEDNGIKIFGSSGGKLRDEDELLIERNLSEISSDSYETDRDGPLVDLSGEDDYVKKALSVLPENSLSGWSIVLDTANGSSYRTSPKVMRELGADVLHLGDAPDGANINNGVGSEFPGKLAEKVKLTKARVGVAHDGDADRVVLCDEEGEILDGDEIMTILALHALKKEKLNKNTLVVTVMSNLGVRSAIEKNGGHLIQTNVGDRYVSEVMFRDGYNLGGESSGHIIIGDLSPSGDGLAGALKIFEVMLDTGEPLSVLRKWLQRFPQCNRALRVKKKLPVSEQANLSAAIANAESQLGNRGRVLVRYSGTESKIRLLVEGPEEEEMMAIMEKLIDSVRKDLEVIDN